MRKNKSEVDEVSPIPEPTYVGRMGQKPSRNTEMMMESWRTAAVMTPFTDDQPVEQCPL